MSYLKDVQTDTKMVISEDGELLDIETKKKQVLVQDNDQYFTIFAKFIGVLNDLSGAAVKLSQYLISNAPINNNHICITAPYRDNIAKAIGVSSPYVKDLLKELCTKNVLLKDKSSPRSSCYFINPEYYWKGDFRGRTQSKIYLLELKYTL